ncbi:GGDEF domain-containing protein (plasmid) [Paracoccus liaowanqingii]|uniref:diguanylate cyclase n=1 Tax=Paracoccus liaowanqingii TaxID=2560053 RepID=A0A4Y5ST67_9RHOB|nr:sensor domain-containing diguanylate cyclase [Paracoccus liaowanqingii]QDA36078.1 GGDEF domain-containing protein [Paracoccus liaowanqingii]
MTEAEKFLLHGKWNNLPELVHNSKDLIAIFDGSYRLRVANSAYCQAYYCDPDTVVFWPDIMRANYLNNRGPVVVTDDIDAWLVEALARRAIQTYRSFEAELHGGKWIWITETVSHEGMTLFYATDISTVRTSSRQLRLERDAARRASWTDPLTGVPNRRYIMDRLEEWHESQSSQAEFGEHVLAVVDLDHFKRINDLYGHDVGDEVLQSFCQHSVKSIRPFDLFGRIGGEEFLFLMPNCSPEVAQLRLSLLQSMILHPKHCSEGTVVTFTFSGGLVRVRKDKDVHCSIRDADKLLYRAKEAGRVRVLY